MPELRFAASGWLPDLFKGGTGVLGSMNQSQGVLLGATGVIDADGCED